MSVDALRLATEFRIAAEIAGGLRDKTVRETAERVKQTQLRLVPRATGHLASTIEVVEVDNGYLVGPSAHYGRFVEFGTARQPPQPFVQPSVEENRRPFVEAMGRIVPW